QVRLAEPPQVAPFPLSAVGWTRLEVFPGCPWIIGEPLPVRQRGAFQIQAALRLIPQAFLLLEGVVLLGHELLRLLAPALGLLPLPGDSGEAGRGNEDDRGKQRGDLGP